MDTEYRRGPRIGELRALGELASLPAAMPLLLSLAPRGDGHAVLCLPGLGGGDRSTGPLRDYLSRLGYRARPWGMGQNRGGSRLLHERLAALVGELAEDSGGRVSLVGWSLGGLFSLRVAAEVPQQVRQVITLGFASWRAKAPRPRPGRFR